MVGTNKQSPADDSTCLRKTRKPAIERKRRERMNQSITQLRALIDDTVKENVAPMTRVDKADILELTVHHLTKARHQKTSTLPTTYDRASYASGFQDCAREVAAFLLNNAIMDVNKLGLLSQHLHGSFNTKTAQFIPDSHISTPVRTRRLPDMTERTPLQLHDISPIHSYGNHSNTSLLGGATRLDRSCDGNLNVEGRTIHYPASRLPAVLKPGLSPVSSVNNTFTSLTSLSFDVTSNSDSFSISTDVIVGYHNNVKLVSIGTGSENKMGHVIRNDQCDMTDKENYEPFSKQTNSVDSA